MLRNRLWISVAALALVLTAGACAKKKGPEGAAAGAGAGGTEATAPAPAGTETGTTGAGTELGSSLPIVHFDYNQAVIRSDAKQPLGKAANRQSCRDTRSLVHVFAAAGFKRDLLDDISDNLWDFDLILPV